ncbi:MAG: HD domain-containing protein [Planctomycetota bacterium]
MNDIPNVDLVLRAISWSIRAHEGQLRKDDVTPYVAHPMRVMTVMVLVFKVEDPEILATAALHDTIEDTTVDFDSLSREFGPEVAQNVAWLTKDARLPEYERERDYFNALAEAPFGVQLCKLADVYDNLADSTGLPMEQRSKTMERACDFLELVREQLGTSRPKVLEAMERQIERARPVP